MNEWDANQVGQLEAVFFSSSDGFLTTMFFWLPPPAMRVASGETGYFCRNPKDKGSFPTDEPKATAAIPRRIEIREEKDVRISCKRGL